MAITGARPTSGARLELVRAASAAPPWDYAGTLTTPDATFQVTARVQADGVTDVTLAPAAPDLAERARLIVRAAWKNAHADGAAAGAPPRRIVRWRDV